MIEAYRAGVPANGKPFPDGSKMAKVHWNPIKMAIFPAATVPGVENDVDFMVKDSKRFADSGGWGWAAFVHDTASGTFTPATAAAKPRGERRPVRTPVPPDREVEGPRLHGLRTALSGERYHAENHHARRDHRLTRRLDAGASAVPAGAARHHRLAPGFPRQLHPGDRCPRRRPD